MNKIESVNKFYESYASWNWFTSLELEGVSEDGDISELDSSVVVDALVSDPNLMAPNESANDGNSSLFWVTLKISWRHK